MNIGFIGAGKIGNTLGRYFQQKNINITGYYDIDNALAEEASKYTKSALYLSMESLVDDSDTIFITTTDNAILKVWESIKKFNIAGKIICHCSGALASTVFDGIDLREAYGYSIHPLFACSSKTESYKGLNNVLFTIEGSKDRLGYVEEFFRKLGNNTKIIAASEKVKYHAAAVITSNQVIALTKLGADLLEQCGFSAEEAVGAVISLMRGTFDNIERQGLIKALTGPIERNDVSTVKKHIAALNEEEVNVYSVLSNILINLAMKKNPEKDYEKMLEVLKQPKL